MQNYGISKKIANLRELLVLYERQIESLDAEHNSLVIEMEQSFIDSKIYWESNIEDQKNNESQYANMALASLEELANGLKLLDTQLFQIDPSYAKRRDVLLLNLAPEVTSRSSEELLIRMEEIATQAKTIASECSLSVKAQPIQEFTMLFSDKRKQLYEQLAGLIVEGQAIRDKAYPIICNNLARKIKELDEKKEAEINKAAEETADIIAALNDQHVQRISEVSSYYESQIVSTLSRNEIDAIRMVQQSLQCTGVLPTSFSEYVNVGSYSIYLGDIAYNPHVLNIVNRLYNGMISNQQLSIPAIIDLKEKSSFVFEMPGEATVAKKTINSLMYSYISSQPASYQRFVLYDPEGRSKGFAPLMEFMRENPSLIYDRVFTTPEQIKDKLKYLSDFIDEFGQSQIADGSDVFVYNQKSAERPQTLTCVCLLNFPKGFDDNMLEYLYNIVNNGNVCGVQTIIQFDANCLRDSNSSYYVEQLSKIRDCSICLEWTNQAWHSSEGTIWKFNEFPSVEILDAFAALYKEKINDESKLILPITNIVPESGWFAGDSASLLSIPIGKAENGNIQRLEFGDPISDGTVHHALVTGSLGSGKSTLLHTIIMSALTTYAPDELNMYLLDFKSGTEFKVYGNYRIPHIKILALDAMQEFGLSVMTELENIAKKRLDMFTAEVERGLPVKDLTSYRKYTGKKMPRILVVADEFQVLFSEEHNRRVAADCATKLADMIALYRVCGIHFVLATQTLSRLRSGCAVSMSTLNEMHVRIGLKCSEIECGLLFGDAHSKKSFEKMGEMKGTGVYDQNCSQEKTIPVGFKVAFCDSDTQNSILQSIQDRYGCIDEEDNTKVFIGDSIPKLSSCIEFQNFDPEEVFSDVPIYLGDPIRIDKPTTINVSRNYRRTLLIVGSNRDMTDRIMAVYIKNAVKSKPHKIIKAMDSSVYLLDGLVMMGEVFSEKIGKVVRDSSADIKYAKDVYDVIPLIDELYTIFESRKNKRRTVGTKKAQFNTIHLLINDFQWIEPIALILQNKSVDDFIVEEAPISAASTNSDDLFGFLNSGNQNDQTGMMDSFIADMLSTKSGPSSNLSYHKKLMALIESGYTCGINVVMSCPDFISIKEIIYEVIPKFQNRIIYALSDKDADRIISEAKVEKLKSNIALFYDGVKPAYQFKPFDI